MVSEKRLLLFTGSPRKKGTSYSFARTIQALADDAGCTAEIDHVFDYFDGKRDLETLKERISRSDVIGLVSPLYYDTLPYPVIWFFEKLSREMRTELQGKGLFAIGQCGFPDATLCQPLIASCRCFAKATGMDWLGGLGYGGGAIIDGTHLEQLGKKGQRIAEAFKIALGDVLRGQTISSKPQELLAINIPKILYRPVAAFLNYRAWTTARRLGVPDLGRKVYLE